jgi:hypothetical protein
MTRSTHVSQASFQHPPSTLQCLVLHPSQSQRILVYDVTSNDNTFVRIVGFEISEARNVRRALEAQRGWAVRRGTMFVRILEDGC